MKNYFIKIFFILFLISSSLMIFTISSWKATKAFAAETGEMPGSITFPGNDQGAEQLLKQFLDPKINRSALTNQLRPGAKDFKAVFQDEAAKKAYLRYQKPWEENKIIIKRHPEQTQLLLYHASTEQLQKGEGPAQLFPGGYSKIASYFRPGLKVYRFKFIKPGEELGYAWDGLIYVNGRWAFFPKPWRVLP